MADAKTSALPAADALTGAEEFPSNQGGVSKKVTAAQISTYIGSGGLTDQAITGATVLSGTASLHARINTISADFTITLPAATTGGQEILISDAVGTASTAGIVKILAAGSDIIYVPGAGQTTALTIGRDHGYVRLVSDGTSAWAIVDRDGVGVDLRAVAGLMADWDFSRGYTLDGSSQYTALLDQSGNGHSLDNAVSPALPVQVSGIGGRLAASGVAKYMTTASNFAPASGYSTVFVVLEKKWRAGTILLQMGTWAATTGYSLLMPATAGSDWTQDGIFVSGNGSNAGRAPRVDSPNPLGVAAGTHTGLVMARLGATTSEIRWNDVQNLTVTLATAGAMNLGAAAIAYPNMNTATMYRMTVFDADLSRANQLLVLDAMAQAYPFLPLCG